MIGTRTGDPRVKRLLDELELKYTVDPDGDFRVVFGLETERTQTAFIRSETSMLSNLEIREVFSVGYECDGPLPADVANALLIFNAHVKLGAWGVLRLPSNRCFAAFTAKIAAETEAPTLMTTLLTVLRIADDVESKLSGGDKF
jgi:hypothetical protein